jgi:hypothetical protein
MNTHVNTLLQKEMSRKEFLATLGLAGASVLGFSSIIKLLTGKSLQSQLGTTQKSSYGYGGSAYGR